MTIADERYIADLGDGTIGFTTPGSSLKAKRIRNDPRVKVQPSDGRGRVRDGSDQVTGTAELLQRDGFERVLAAVKAKYGWQATVFVNAAKLLKLVGRDQSSDTGVVITLD